MEASIDAPPLLSLWILRVNSLYMLDGQRQRAYIVFFPEGIVPRAAATLMAHNQILSLDIKSF